MRPSGQAARAARLFMATQAESGHICPLTMTNASIAALSSEPAIARNWLPKIRGRLYDPALRPWWEKSAATLGMGMTERAGRHRRARQYDDARRPSPAAMRSPAPNGSCRRRCATPFSCSPRRPAG